MKLRIHVNNDLIQFNEIILRELSRDSNVCSSAIPLVVGASGVIMLMFP